MSFEKLPFKMLDIPLTKFKDEAIPFHQESYDKYKQHIHKCINSSDSNLDYNTKAREIDTVVEQLKTLLYDLDTLQSQAQESDVDKFIKKVKPIRAAILDLVCKYDGLRKICQLRTNLSNGLLENDLNCEDSLPTNQNLIELLINDDIEAMKLEEQNLRLRHVEAIEEDIVHVNDMFVDLHGLVHQQGEVIDQLEENVETTSAEVSDGLKEIIKASRYKKASYPIMGASIGVVAGGPVGAALGFKVGLAVSVVCATVGYLSGSFIKRKEATFITNTEFSVNAEATASAAKECDKKTI